MRHNRRTTRQEHPDRCVAALLATIKVNGTIDFGVQTRHHVAHDFRNPLGCLVLRDGHPAQRYESNLPFQCLGLFKGNLEALGDLLRDGITGHRDAAGVNFLVFNKNQIGRTRTDIKQHRAAVQLRVVVAQAVVERHRCHIDDLGLQPHLHDAVGNLADVLGLGRDDHRTLLAHCGVADELVVPNDLAHRERDVLLHLVLHHLEQFVLGDGRQPHETRKYHLTGEREHQRRGADPACLHDLADSGLQIRTNTCVGLRIASHIGHAVVGQLRRAPVPDGEFGQYNFARAHIEREDTIRREHYCTTS